MSQFFDNNSHTPLASNINFVFEIKSQRFVYLDDWLKSLVGDIADCSPEQLLAIVHPDDRDIAQHACKEVLKGEAFGSVKFRILSKDQDVWLGVMPFLELNDDQPVVFGNIMDITAEVENFSSISRYANKKNSVLHMLAHDLRGPLGIANSMVTVLEKNIDQPKSIEKTKAISTIIQEAIDLIGDLINREFLETVGAALVKKRIDIVKKLAEYIEECKRSAHIADRNFILTSSSPIVQIELDEAKFMQVVNNLISNALKFTHANATLSISIEDHHDGVELIFSDDGIGIPAELLPHVFDPFTVSKRTGIHGEPTTGLGLSIVKEVITWHKGTITCDSKEGQGTTFTITFPRDLDQAVRNN